GAGAGPGTLCTTTSRIAASTSSAPSRSAPATAASPLRRRAIRSARAEEAATAASATPASPAGGVIAPAPRSASRLVGHQQLLAAAREQGECLLVHLDDRLRQPRVVERVGIGLPVVDRPVEEARERQAARLVLRVLVDDQERESGD